MKTFEEIKQMIKQQILVERLELEHVTADEIEDEAPLFGEGLGLDSVEALDVIAGVEQVFGVKLQGSSEQEFREHLYSVETLAKFVQSHLKE